MKTNLSHQNIPTLKDYETIFASSEDIIDFTNTMSNLFPDYIRNKKCDSTVFSDHKISNTNNSDDGSEFQKELNSQISFLNSLKQTLYPYAKSDNPEINKPQINSDSNDDKPNKTKLSSFIKIEVVDALVDSIVISTLFSQASKKVKNSSFIYDTITQKKISSVNKDIIDSEKVQKLVQKRIFLLSMGKLRPTPEEAEKKKMRFIPASKLNLKSILKNPNPQSNSNNNLESNTTSSKDQNKNFSIHLKSRKNDIDNETNLSQSNKVPNSSNSNPNGKADLANQHPKNCQKRVHFIPEKGDVVPANAVVFDYKESAKLMKKTREEEKAIRKREEEFMKKVKSDFISKQRSTKNKFTPPASTASYDFGISLKPKTKPRSRSAKTKPSKPKTTNPSSSLYPSYYSPKAKSGVVTNSTDKDDRIRRKVPIRSHSPQMTYRTQYDENSNVIRKGKSTVVKEKPKIKPKPKQVKPKPRTGYEY